MKSEPAPEILSRRQDAEVASEPLELLRQLAEEEYTPAALGWISAAAAAFHRHAGSTRLSLDRRLRLPGPECQARALRDFWLRRAYHFCDGPTERARIGKLLDEIAVVERILHQVTVAGARRESELSEFRRAVLFALRQGKVIPRLRQLRRLLGVS